MNKKIIGLTAVVVVAGAIIVFNLLNRNSTAPVGSLSTSPSVSGKLSGYTLIEVSKHKDGSSCWSVVNGKVYDLTAWINQHPGGPSRILSICGIDGSSAFNIQHEGQSRPANELAGFYIGDLLK
jgi:cytochrome b involved in lipid metabolism